MNEAGACTDAVALGMVKTQLRAAHTVKEKQGIVRWNMQTKLWLSPEPAAGLLGHPSMCAKALPVQAEVPIV